LTGGEAAGRLRAVGPNAVRTHQARGFAVLARQFRSPLLIKDLDVLADGVMEGLRIFQPACHPH
jgi:hypothetical protein